MKGMNREVMELKGQVWFFFFNDTATTEIYTLSLHDALPISLNLTNQHIEFRCLTLTCCREMLPQSFKIQQRGEIGRAHV